MESCLYCGKRTKVFPVKMWDKDSYRYYCDEHYGEAFQFEKEERNRFIEYYSVPERRKWLTKETLELWEKLKTSYDASPM